MTRISHTRSLGWSELGWTPPAGWASPVVHGWATAEEVLPRGAVSGAAGVYIVALDPDDGMWPVADVPPASGLPKVLYVGRSERLASRVRAFVRSAGLAGRDPGAGHWAGRRLANDPQRHRARFAWLTPGGGERYGDFAYLWSTTVEGLVLAAAARRPEAGDLPRLQNKGWAPRQIGGAVAEAYGLLHDALSHDTVQPDTLLDVGAQRMRAALAEILGEEPAVREELRWRAFKLRSIGRDELWLCVGRTEARDGYFATLWTKDRQVYPRVFETGVPWSELPTRAAAVLEMALVETP